MRDEYIIMECTIIKGGQNEKENIQKNLVAVLSLTMVIASSVLIMADEENPWEKEIGACGTMLCEVTCNDYGCYADTHALWEASTATNMKVHVGATLEVMSKETGAVSIGASGSADDDIWAELSHSAGNGYIAYRVTSYHSASAYAYGTTHSASAHYTVENEN